MTGSLQVLGQVRRYQRGTLCEMTIRKTARERLITVFGSSSKGSHFFVDQSVINNRCSGHGETNATSPKAMVSIALWPCTWQPCIRCISKQLPARPVHCSKDGLQFTIFNDCLLVDEPATTVMVLVKAGRVRLRARLLELHAVFKMLYLIYMLASASSQACYQVLYMLLKHYS